MTESELRKYHLMITDCWELLKRHSNPVDDKEFWNDLLYEANKTFVKHGKSTMCYKILSAITDEIEEQFKLQQGTGSSNDSQEQVTLFEGGSQ